MNTVRSIRLKNYIFMCVLCALSFGCESDDDEGESNASAMSASISYDEFINTLVSTTCEVLSECCELGAEGAESCTMMMSGDLASQYSSENYDAALGGRCAAELANAPAPTCASIVSDDDSGSDLGMVAPTCDELFTLIRVSGDKQPGEECESTNECAPVEGATLTCVGTCEAEFRAAAGDECNSTCTERGISVSCIGFGGGDEGFNRACYRNDGLHCGSSGTCEAVIEEGEACEQRVSSPCAEGLRCAEGVCAPKLTAGETCENDSDCVSEFCGNGSVCADLIADGEMCQEEIPCASNFCSNDTNQCLAEEDGALGFICAFLSAGG